MNYETLQHYLQLVNLIFMLQIWRILDEVRILAMTLFGIRVHSRIILWHPAIAPGVCWYIINCSTIQLGYTRGRGFESDVTWALVSLHVFHVLFTMFVQSSDLARVK